MKKVLQICLVMCSGCLLLPTVGMTGKGYMGGAGNVSVAEEPVVTDTSESDGGVPDTVEGPINDKKSDSGKLFGDLYKLLRQQGGVGDKKLVPQVNADGPVIIDGFQRFDVLSNPTNDSDIAIGGEPVLTVIDPSDLPVGATSTVGFTDYSDYGWYAAETVNGDIITYVPAQAPTPAQCVQPVASYERWGDISIKTGLTKNRLPMVITYDATWKRSECEVGELIGTPVVDSATGDLTLDINHYFVEPCLNEDGTSIADADCTWEDPVNGEVTYPYGVLWADLIGEVSFGRLNIGQAPEAVLQSAFDEAINNINSPDTTAIEIDAAGRLLLTKNVYDPLLVYKVTDLTQTPQEIGGEPVLIGTVKKAIDSPLENIALYVKLMQDGHLVTPADERIPIDRSKNGGIPLWKMLELTDGPAAAALRPTIDIDKMIYFQLDALVVPIDSATTYYTYYQCVDANSAVIPCLIESDEEGGGEWVANPLVVDRVLKTVSDQGACPQETVNEETIYEETIYLCEGPFTGITTDDASTPDATDLNFAAAFLAAAADKTGDIDVDMVVYLNSILGINKVVGYSAYDEDGNPTDEATDYQLNPEYFNFSKISPYGTTGRGGTFNGRGYVDGEWGKVTVLQEDVSQPKGSTWNKTIVGILGAMKDGRTIFDNIERNYNVTPHTEEAATDNILGFTQQADDNLSVINFIHTYQIPELR